MISLVPILNDFPGDRTKSRLKRDKQNGRMKRKLL